MRKLVSYSLVALGSFTIGAAVLADQPSVPPATDPAPTPVASPVVASQSDLICRRIREIGSRLKSNRVCMTRAEWAEQRRIGRQAIERGQTSACVPGAGC